jgi:hypothetical protein
MAAGLPRFYANGLGLAGTATDVIMVLFHNGQPVCAINLAFPTAKGLVEDLTVALNDIEAALNQPIKTPRETAEGIQRLRQAAEKKP